MSRQPAAVVVSGVDHAYGDFQALTNVNLEVEAGESMALLGPSACGKTTLLRTIAGLERPVRGEIRLGDELVAAPGTWVPPERREVGMVFQNWALFPHLTVADNVGYGLPRGERKGTRVDRALDLVGLAGLGDRAPATLSGGQQQRVALARALAPEPGVLLLDEPFSNLDTSMRVEVRAEVHRLLLDLGITALFVTHDQEEAFVLGDRVAVMQQGQVVQVATPQEIYATPETRWIAEFVGTASLVPGNAQGDTAECAIGQIPLETPMMGSVDVLLRPEQLRLTEGGGDATVDLVEFYGHDAMVFVSLGDTRVRIRTEPNISARRGDAVTVEFRGRAARAFPSAERSV